MICELSLLVTSLFDRKYLDARMIVANICSSKGVKHAMRPAES